MGISWEKCLATGIYPLTPLGHTDVTLKRCVLHGKEGTDMIRPFLQLAQRDSLTKIGSLAGLGHVLVDRQVLPVHFETGNAGSSHTVGVGVVQRNGRAGTAYWPHRWSARQQPWSTGHRTPNSCNRHRWNHCHQQRRKRNWPPGSFRRTDNPAASRYGMHPEPCDRTRRYGNR